MRGLLGLVVGIWALNDTERVNPDVLQAQLAGNGNGALKDVLESDPLNPSFALV